MEGSFLNNSLSHAVDTLQNTGVAAAPKCFGGHGAPGGPDGPAQPPAAVGAPQTTFAVLSKCHTRERGENEAWQEFLSVGAYVYLYP